MRDVRFTRTEFTAGMTTSFILLFCGSAIAWGWGAAVAVLSGALLGATVVHRAVDRIISNLNRWDERP